MAVISRPEQGQRPPETHAEPVGPPEPMNVRLANALVTEAPMTRRQLDTVLAHFKLLANMLLVSGPVFASQRRNAVQMANRAIDRINGILDRNEAERRERERLEGRLLPIEE